MTDQVFDLKFPRYVLYDTESLKILIATDYIENIHDWLISTKMETVSTQFTREADRLEALESRAQERANKDKGNSANKENRGNNDQ